MRFIQLTSLVGLVAGGALAQLIPGGETAEDATKQISTLLHDEKTAFIGSLASVKPAEGKSSPEPAVGIEYFAPCFDENTVKEFDGARPGDLLFLAEPMYVGYLRHADSSSETWKYVVSTNPNKVIPDKTVAFTVGSNPDPAVVDPRHSVETRNGGQRWDPKRPAWRRGFMSKPRVVFHGDIALVDGSKAAMKKLAKCFTDYHSDAKAWLPGSGPHSAVWVRLSPSDVYFVGGFGDEHYIGHVKNELYRSTFE
ncbi:hypothetical protein MSPP1_001491 [Malassezia sp. CBS 17886]|nr:hypothetical protein MSPP1_001491 [Malassezia sp. CBS 17886]